MEKDKYNELEKAILNSNFVKNNPKLTWASDRKKVLAGATKIKRHMVGYTQTIAYIPKQEFYKNLMELRITKKPEENLKIDEEIMQGEIYLKYKGFLGILTENMEISKSKSPDGKIDIFIFCGEEDTRRPGL